MVDERHLPEKVVLAAEKHSLANAVAHSGMADVGAVLGRLLGEFPELKTSASSVRDVAANAVERVNSLSKEEQVALLAEKYPETQSRPPREGREGLPLLKNASKGKVAFRLPPEPSGYMTIGHAMAFNINFLYKEEYSGELWLRFEDTNPRKAARRYYESFRRGTKWLGITYEHEKNVSDDLEQIYEKGGKMIGDGLAYACSCEPGRVKEFRFQGKPCEHRERTPEESQRIWSDMLQRKYKEGEVVVRYKGDMSSLDTSLRDPNIFRVIDHSHPLTGDRYSVWPTYDLANTIEDELCRITHVLRSSEFHNSLQALLRSSLGFRPVEIIQFSRFNFKGTPVSKRLLRPLVEGRQVSGWDDPRMPTVDGIRRRGILPEAIRRFTLQVGYTKSEHEYDWSLLYSVNRKLLDPVSKRLFFVPNPIEMEVRDAPASVIEIPYHPDKDLGSRRVKTGDRFLIPGEDAGKLSPGDRVRLMDLFNVKISSVRDGVLAAYNGNELVAGIKKMQWATPDSVNTDVIVTGPLFDAEGKYNERSLVQVHGVAEPSVSEVKEGEVVQFPRVGFCRLDSPNSWILAHR